LFFYFPARFASAVHASPMSTIDLAHLRAHHSALANYLVGSLLALLIAAAVLTVIVMRQRAAQKKRRQQERASKRGKSRRRR
jgi:uncharacterized protein (DUF2062 family)